MRVLFIGFQLPYAIETGSTIVSKKFLDYLCSKYELTFACLIKNDDLDNLPEFLKIYKPKLKDFLYYKLDKPRSVRNYVNSLFKNIPLSIYRNHSRKIRAEIEKNIIEKNYDIIFCNHLFMIQYVPEKFYLRTILLQQNAEYMIWKRYSKIENNILIRLMTSFESFRMLKYEANICNKIPVVMASPEDINALRPHANRTDYFVTYHLGHDELLNRKALENKHTNRLLFIGTMTWEPNKDGVKWFVETIYPKIKEKNPDVSFIVVGKHNGSFLSENEDISIKILGYVSDLDDIYENTDLFICPLRFGSGMKVKVLHAMYRGLPFVTTSVGAESIDLKSGEHCFIADTPDEFAEKTLTLLCDSNLWKKFSVNSRTLAEKLYTWETEYSRLDTSFKKLMSLRGTNPAVSET